MLSRCAHFIRKCGGGDPRQHNWHCDRRKHEPKLTMSTRFCPEKAVHATVEPACVLFWPDRV